MPARRPIAKIIYDAFCAIPHTWNKALEVTDEILKIQGKENANQWMETDNPMPHGTIICPHCGCAHSGLIDAIICDECERPFWSIEVIERQLKRIKEAAPYDDLTERGMPRKHYIIAGK